MPLHVYSIEYANPPLWFTDRLVDARVRLHILLSIRIIIFLLLKILFRFDTIIHHKWPNT